MTKDIKVKAPKKRKAASLDKRKARGGWLFVMPFIIGFVLIYLPIIIDSIKYSFCEVKIIPQSRGGGIDLTFVGWANYKEVLTGTEYEKFLPTLLEGLQTIALEIPMILMFSLFMAVLLNQKMVGRAFFRAMLFLPVVLATGIMETVSAQDVNAMSSSAGIDDGSGQSVTSNLSYFTSVQSMFAMLELPVGGGLIQYVSMAVESIFAIVNRSGVQILIFLAGLQSISPAIYESVQIDGATSWETFWKITFPMISPMILVNAVYTVIDSFTTESNPVMQYVMEVYTNSKVYSSAMSWMYFLIVVLVIAAVAGIFSAFVFYQRRD